MIQGKGEGCERRLEEYDTEQIKQWLSAYQAEAEAIQDRQEQILTLRSFSERKTPSWSGMPGTPMTPHGRENAIIARMRAEKSLQSLLDEHEKSTAALSAAIDSLVSEKWKKVMRLRYLSGLEWSEVVAHIYGDKPDYEAKLRAYTRRVYRDHARALLAMAKEWGQRK